MPALPEEDKKMAQERLKRKKIFGPDLIEIDQINLVQLWSCCNHKAWFNIGIRPLVSQRVAGSRSKKKQEKIIITGQD